MILKVNGTWQEVARGFDTFDGASAWAQDVMEAGEALSITGYRIEEEDGRVVCSVEATT